MMKGALALCTTQLLLSIWNLLAEDVLSAVEQDISVPEFLFLRQAFTTIVLACLSKCNERVELRHLPKLVLAKLILCGFFGIFVISYAYFYGLMLTDPTSMSLFDGPLVPVAVFALALTTGSEKLAPNWSGILLQTSPTVVCACGAIAVLWGTSSTVGATEQALFYRGVGVLLLCLECLCMAISIMLQRSLAQVLPPFALTGCMYLTGMICSVVYLGLFRQVSLVGVVQMAIYQAVEKPQFGVGLLYCIFLHSAAAIVLLNYGAKRLEASTVSLFSCLQPVMTVVLEGIVRQKLPSGLQVVGIGLVFFGIRLKAYVESLRGLKLKHSDQQLKP